MKLRGLKNITMLAAITVTVMLIAGLAACGGSEQPHATEQPTVANSQVAGPEQVRFNFPDKDYSEFNHESEQHARMPCTVCHTENTSAAKMKFPGHIPCSSCHVEHFKQETHTICSVCHTGPATADLKPVPQLASFGAKFSHAKHTPVTNCATCHSPTARGAGYSKPSRSNAHTTCLSCHGADKPVAIAMAEKGSNIDSCGTCHQPGNPPMAERAANYVGGFRHASHSRKLGCSSCHTVQAGEGSNQVTAPVQAMHFSSGRGVSCATCHNGKRAFGGPEDFTSCKRCHTGGTFSF